MLKIGTKRFKLKGRRVVADTGPAPIRGVLEASGPALALFVVAEQREIAGAAIGAGVEWYMAAIIPLFFTWYAEKHGYRQAAHRGSRAEMQGEFNPLVFTGRTRAAVLSGMGYEIKKTGRNVSARISMPLPANDQGIVYGLFDRSQVATVLKQITAEEVGRLAKHVAVALTEILSNREPSDPPRQPSVPAMRRDPPTGITRSRGPAGKARSGAARGTYSPVRMA